MLLRQRDFISLFDGAQDIYSDINGLLSTLPGLMGRGNIISTALFISSSMKLLPILTAIWEYDVPASARAVGWAVVVNNIEALTSNSPLKWYVADCSFIGDNVFEYANFVIAGSVDTCVNRMDYPRLDHVGGCVSQTCIVGIDEVGPRGRGNMELGGCIKGSCLGMLERN